MKCSSSVARRVNTSVAKSSISCASPGVSQRVNAPMGSLARRAAVVASRNAHVGDSVLFGILVATCNQPNEEYTTCGTCDHSCFEPVVRVCPDVCRVGCFCRAGFLRNSQGVCVSEKECGSECGDSMCTSHCICSTSGRLSINTACNGVAWIIAVFFDNFVYNDLAMNSLNQQTGVYTNCGISFSIYRVGGIIVHLCTFSSLGQRRGIVESTCTRINVEFFTLRTTAAIHNASLHTDDRLRRGGNHLGLATGQRRRRGSCGRRPWLQRSRRPRAHPDLSSAERSVPCVLPAL